LWAYGDGARGDRPRLAPPAGDSRPSRGDGVGVSASLAVEEAVRAFGGVRALDGASLEVEPRSITGLIGPNGAGKSTLFNCISGFLRPESGRVLLDGRRVDRRSAHRIA